MPYYLRAKGLNFWLVADPSCPGGFALSKAAAEFAFEFDSPKAAQAAFDSAKQDKIAECKLQKKNPPKWTEPSSQAEISSAPELSSFRPPQLFLGCCDRRFVALFPASFGSGFEYGLTFDPSKAHVFFSAEEALRAASSIGGTPDDVPVAALPIAASGFQEPVAAAGRRLARSAVAPYVAQERANIAQAANTPPKKSARKAKPL